MMWGRWIVGIVSFATACAPPRHPSKTPLIIQSESVAAIGTDLGRYTAGDPVVVSFTDLPGNGTDWIALSRAHSSATSFTSWTYTSAKTNGVLSLPSNATGTFVARAYASNGFDILAESATFGVHRGPLKVSASLTRTGVVVVAFSGMSESPTDWVSIALQGSSSFASWRFTGGAEHGKVDLPRPSVPGTYVAHAHFNNAFGVEAESTPFAIEN